MPEPEKPNDVKYWSEHADNDLVMKLEINTEDNLEDKDNYEDNFENKTLHDEEETMPDVYQPIQRAIAMQQGSDVNEDVFDAAEEDTGCVNSSVTRFAKKFLWKFPRPVGHTTAAM